MHWRTAIEISLIAFDQATRRPQAASPPPEPGRTLIPQVTQMLIYSDRSEPALRIGLSDVPNGIFLPDVIAHAAAGNGVAVQGSPRSVPGTAYTTTSPASSGLTP